MQLWSQSNRHKPGQDVIFGSPLVRERFWEGEVWLKPGKEDTTHIQQL